MTTMNLTCWRRRFATLTCCLALVPATARGQGVTIEYFQGTAFNLPTPLTITQTGQPRISFIADYSVRPLEARIYYNTRIGTWSEDTGWLFELLHHKIYLDNPPPEVESFEVTHGYNLITVNRAWRRGAGLLVVGGGVVVGHSNSIVRGRGRPITASYTLAGVTVQGAVGRRLNLTRQLFVSVEGKVTAAWARVPIADGRATAPNVALHLLAGLGAAF